MNRILIQWLLVTVFSNLLGPVPPWPDNCVVITAKETGRLPEPTHLYRVDVNRIDVNAKAVRLLDKGEPFWRPERLYFAPDGRDGWLYFAAKELDGSHASRIWAMNINGRTVQLTSDSWGGGIDKNPLVSVQQKHLLFETQRTGGWRCALAQDGLTQGPGCGISLPIYGSFWSATHSNILWYSRSIAGDKMDIITFAEYDVVANADTGQTLILKGVLFYGRISISPDGAFLAVQQSNKRAAVFDFAGQRRVEFLVDCDKWVGDKLVYCEIAPTWSNRDTVVFRNPSDLRAIYRGDLTTGQVTRIPVQGLREVDEIVDLVAWPGSSRK